MCIRDSTWDVGQRPNGVGPNGFAQRNLLKDCVQSGRRGRPADQRVQDALAVRMDSQGGPL
eukprot:5746644-Alexandrium_andersonii.AAC.1